MKRAYGLPGLALLGLVIGIGVAIYSSATPGSDSERITPFHPPYPAAVAGSGVVEASTGNIAVGTPVSGIVTAIDVKVGAHVKAGDPLFTVDDRALRASLQTAIAGVAEAAAAVRKPEHRLAHAEQLERRDPSAISAQTLQVLRDTTAQARASLQLARAQEAQIRVDIQRHTIRAPVKAEVLRQHIRLGEYLGNQPASPPLLILGDTDRLFVRVSVDEHDAWRVHPGAAATAYVRGEPQLSTPLHYEYTEPYMVPKTMLTGISTERTDTRVLQVLYSFKPGALPVHIGQLLDVYIDASSDARTKAGG
jgi:HlyD family secretion protein